MGPCPGPQLPWNLLRSFDDRKNLFLYSLAVTRYPSLACPGSVTGRKAPRRKLFTAALVVLGTFSNSPLTSVLEHGKMFNPAGNSARLSFRRGLQIQTTCYSRADCRWLIANRLYSTGPLGKFRSAEALRIFACLSPECFRGEFENLAKGDRRSSEIFSGGALFWALFCRITEKCPGYKGQSPFSGAGRSITG